MPAPSPPGPPPPPASAHARLPARLLPAALIVLGLALFGTAIPGVFIIDDDAYIATVVGLRDGSLRLPSTGGLPPSPELLSFDPAPRSRIAITTPVAPNTPPLYALVALPFSLLGVRGLIALQILSYLLCSWLVFRVVRRETGRGDLAWFAAAVFAFGGYGIEYAQGIWPHATTMALLMAAADQVSRLHRGGDDLRGAFLRAAAAGGCVSLAAGMRYQNVVIVAALGASLAWMARRRATLPGFALGAALPLAASAAMNASRLGSWNPVSKGGRYLELGKGRGLVTVLEQALTSTWARLVDYTAWPASPPSGEIIPKSATTGAFLLLTGIRKAMLQSAPWVIVALLALAWCWRRRGAIAPESRPLLRSFALIAACLVGTFALYGFRYEGWCFNERYLLDLMPMFTVTLALALAGEPPRWWLVGAGLLGGAALGAVAVQLTARPVGQLLLMKVPLVLAAVLAVAWLVRARWPAGARVLAAALGLSLGWAAAVHLLGDVPASRLLREANFFRLRALVHALPEDDRPAAVFAYWGAKDAFGPLLLERDLVIVDPWVDEGRDAPMLLDALLRQGRDVYVETRMPPEVLASLTAGRKVEVVREPWLLRIAP